MHSEKGWEMALVEARGLFKAYERGGEEVHALRDVSFTIESGAFAVLTGPSGSGKTTLLNLMGGIDVPDRGEIVVGGEDIGAYGPSERARFRVRTMGFVYQAFNLVPALTAVENVALPLLIDGVEKKAAYAAAVDMLTELGLGDRLQHTETQLSGGQRQRVSVARALVTEPSLILADEPTGNLDSHSGADVLRLLQEAAARRGATVVVATHDIAAVDVAAQRLSIKDGVVLSTQT
ncbi:MAG: ABC transporter ATP-binding protein [Acidimicrobiia bacterium]|nr:ABC transporter ATP-binding protein [Acidimicrobiia bacterium]